MNSYTIKITHYQSNILHMALAGRTSDLSQEDLNELAVIARMLKLLPKYEAKAPGVTHGFAE